MSWIWLAAVCAYLAGLVPFGRWAADAGDPVFTVCITLAWPVCALLLAGIVPVLWLGDLLTGDDDGPGY